MTHVHGIYTPSMPWGWGGVGWRGLEGKASACFLPNNKYSYVMCRSCFLFVEEG